MNIIITEQQLKYIIEQEQNSSFANDVKEMARFAKEIVLQCKANYNIDLQLLATWGAAVGGLVMPLDHYIRTSDIELSEKQISLVLTGAIAMLVFDNKQVYEKVLSKVKEEGLVGVFNNVTTKGTRLKKSFIDFLLSLNTTFRNLSGLVRYSFLIPIIGDLETLAESSSNLSETSKLITERLITAGVISISSEVLYFVIRKILKRLKDN